MFLLSQKGLEIREALCYNRNTHIIGGIIYDLLY